MHEIKVDDHRSMLKALIITITHVIIALLFSFPFRIAAVTEALSDYRYGRLRSNITRSGPQLQKELER